MKKNLIKIIFGILLAALFTGCDTPSQNLNKISIGMSKVEVIQILGQPQSTRANREEEFLVYSLKEEVSKPGTTMFPISIDGQYFVKIVGGHVESYGKMGDFDSTKPFETKSEIDVNVNQK